ncbi:hypothetical protein JCM10908_004247 [Rhodotorula pacifica]|uniref:uncharacterized protein n=1 Tax=Rhodotorula pacifica TaxID=1495444 RepID=UPI00317F0801
MASSSTSSADPTSLAGRPAPGIPHELLVQIIHYAAPPLATDVKSHRRRRRPLRRYALVNKAWHGAALDEASQHLFINLHEPGWAQSADTATERILTARKRAEERGRNVKTLALFGEKHMPDSSADVLRSSFEHAHIMTLQKMKKPMRLLAGSNILTSLRLYEINSPEFIGAYPALKRLELIDCFAESFVSTWTKKHFPVLETAVLQIKARRRDVPFTGLDSREDEVERPDTLRALAIAGGFQYFPLLGLEAQVQLEHVHIGTTEDVATLFLTMCRTITTSLSLDPNGTGVTPPGMDWRETWRELASSTRISQLKSLKLYNVIDPKADPWFLNFAQHFLATQKDLDADFEYAHNTARLSLTEWDPLNGVVRAMGEPVEEDTCR